MSGAAPHTCDRSDRGFATLGAVHAAPAFHSRGLSLERALEWIDTARSDRVNLLAFGEAWLPGYPYWAHRDHPLIKQARRTYIEQAVLVPGPETDRLCEAAGAAGTDVVLGVAELDGTTRSTVYCSLVFIGADHGIVGVHRKLKPTDAERRVWGEGDGSGLVVYDRPYGRVSGLNCWEHQMMLPGYALAAKGTQIHVAAWPDIRGSNSLLLSRSFAAQAGAYCISVGGGGSEEDIASDFTALGPPRLERRTAIIGPDGEVLELAEEGPDALITATVELDITLDKRALCDIGGHYSRPDVFEFGVRPPNEAFGSGPMPA